MHLCVRCIHCKSIDSQKDLVAHDHDLQWNDHLNFESDNIEQLWFCVGFTTGCEGSQSKSSESAEATLKSFLSLNAFGLFCANNFACAQIVIVDILLH